MKITGEEIERVALLARLHLTDDEKARFNKELDSILGYMDKLNQLDTAQVKPFTHALEAANAFRPDRVTNHPDAEALLANAPDRDATFFKVPKIIE